MPSYGGGNAYTNRNVAPYGNFFSYGPRFQHGGGFKWGFQYGGNYGQQSLVSFLSTLIVNPFLLKFLPCSKQEAVCSALRGRVVIGSVHSPKNRSTECHFP